MHQEHQLPRHSTILDFLATTHAYAHNKQTFFEHGNKSDMQILPHNQQNFGLQCLPLGFFRQKKETDARSVTYI